MTYWHAVGLEKQSGCLQTIALSYQIRAGGCMLSILNNLIPAEKNAVNSCRLIIADRYQPETFFFVW